MARQWSHESMGVVHHDLGLAQLIPRTGKMLHRFLDDPRCLSITQAACSVPCIEKVFHLPEIRPVGLQMAWVIIGMRKQGFVQLAQLKNKRCG